MVSTVEGTAVPAPDSTAPAEAAFAAAYAAARRGSTQEALNAYREVQSRADERVRHDAMFNSGNLYLTQARDAQGRGDPAAMVTLAELAKTSYRELLRENSEDWDARYNLEKALRMAPDLGMDEGAFGTPPSTLQQAPTGPGTALGLP